MKKRKRIAFSIAFACTLFWGVLSYARGTYQIKIANVNDFFMQQHYRSGEYVDIERALDKGVVGRTVWWSNRENIERESLVKKAVMIPDSSVQRLIAREGSLGVKEIKYPERVFRLDNAHF
jgi:hypothetical protein